MNSNLHAGFLQIQFTATSRRLVYLVYSLRSNISLRLISYYKAAGERAKLATNLTESKYD